jgi:hypothetical protein
LELDHDRLATFLEYLAGLKTFERRRKRFAFDFGETAELPLRGEGEGAEPCARGAGTF